MALLYKTIYIFVLKIRPAGGCVQNVQLDKQAFLNLNGCRQPQDENEDREITWHYLHDLDHFDALWCCGKTAEAPFQNTTFAYIATYSQWPLY